MIITQPTRRYKTIIPLYIYVIKRELKPITAIYNTQLSEPTRVFADWASRDMFGAKEVLGNIS